MPHSLITFLSYRLHIHTACSLWKNHSNFHSHVARDHINQLFYKYEALILHELVLMTVTQTLSIIDLLQLISYLITAAR